MSPNREWKTEGEIRSIVHEEMKSALDAQNRILERQTETLDRIADATQLQMQSALIMHGNPEFGIKGVLPDLLERVTGIETREGARDTLWDVRHTDHTDRLEKLERGQHRLRRFLTACVRFVSSKSDDSLSWKRVAALGGGLGTTWYALKAMAPLVGRKLAAAAHALMH